MNNQEFFEALTMLAEEKGIPEDYLLEKISAAITIAVRRDYGGKENIVVTMEPETGAFAVALHKTVVDEVLDSDEELLLDEARRYKATAQVGDVVEIPLETKEFGRIAAQTAKHVIRQGIREAERGQQMTEMRRRNQELVTALVRRVDPRSGNAVVEIGRTESTLPAAEQMPGEVLAEGTHVRVFIVDVKDSEKGPRLLISRTHPGLVKRLFEMEVPELQNGEVELKSIAREAGSRTKMAVLAHGADVDPVGACIGNRGARVNAIVEELGGEKIDIIEYSDDPVVYITAALSPAKVTSVEPDPEGAKACRVVVPDNQLSLAIGNKGQNVRLAARLTGWKIDIRSESGSFDDEDAGEDEQDGGEE